MFREKDREVVKVQIDGHQKERLKTRFRTVPRPRLNPTSPVILVRMVPGNTIWSPQCNLITSLISLNREVDLRE